MAHIRIELNRGLGWTVRQEGNMELTTEALIAALPAYAIQYPHRAFLDGAMVAEATPAKRSRR